MQSSNTVITAFTMLSHYSAHRKLAFAVTPVTVTPVMKQALSDSQTLANTFNTHSI